MSLKNLVEQIKKTKKIAESDPIKGNILTSHLRAGNKQRAMEDLKDLYIQYKNELKHNLILILAYGSDAQNFANIASEQTGSETAKFDSLYKDLVDAINPTYYSGRESISATIASLNTELERIANDMDVLSFPSLVYKTGYPSKLDSKETALQVVKKMINTDIGPEMSALYVLDKLSKIAMSNLHDSVLVATVVVDKDEDVSLAMQGLGSLSNNIKILPVLAGASTAKIQPVSQVETVTEESTLAVLEDIRKSLKGGSSAKTKRSKKA